MRTVWPCLSQVTGWSGVRNSDPAARSGTDVISTILFIKIQTVYYLYNYTTNIAEALPEPRLGIASAECLQQIDKNVLWTKEKWRLWGRHGTVFGDLLFPPDIISLTGILHIKCEEKQSPNVIEVTVTWRFFFPADTLMDVKISNRLW